MAFVFINSPSRVAKTGHDEESQNVLEKLEDYLEENRGMLIGTLLLFWADQKTALTPEEIQGIIGNGAVPDIILEVWHQDYSLLAGKSMQPLWQNAAKAGWKATEHMHGIHMGESKHPRGAPENIPGFLDTGSLVLKWIHKHGAELVTNSTDTQKQAIQWLLAESVNEKMSADQLASRIRQTVGLTRPQAAANQRYYQNVVNKLRKDHPGMKEETILQRARAAAEKYRQKQLRSRALTIARTEIAMAYNQGQDAAIRYYMKLGLLGPRVRKTLVAARGDRACEICRALDGQAADIDEDITAIYGKMVRGKKIKRVARAYIPPVHPRCACSLKYEEVKEA